MNYIENRGRFRTILIGLCILLVVIMMVAMQFGPADVTTLDATRSVFGKVPFLEGLLQPDQVEDAHELIIWKIRFPRIVLAALAGATLAASGAIYQAIFRNPMADPYVLGISSGAALGAASAIVMGIGATAVGLSGVSVFAFTGAMLASLFVWTAAGGGRRSTPMSLLLSGIALNFLLSALLSVIMVFNREQVDKIIFWTMGSFAAAKWDHVFLLVLPVLVGLVVYRIYARDLNLMLMGEDAARGLGVHVQKVRLGLLVLSSLLTAIVVSVCGVIGFVGLIVPHAVRLVSGPDHRTLVPLSALGGAMFLVIGDTLARTIAAPAEIPIGAVTALIGAPYFLFLLQRNRSKMGRS